MLIIYSAIAFFLAITVHEFMHAWTANYLGDPTPGRAGRISLNPVRHIDPIGTILIPAVLIIAGSPIVFGYAKPVPINPNNFKNPRLGSALTAVAGPIANFVLAAIVAITFKYTGGASSVLGVFMINIVLINLTLMIFNLIPIPPLDGSKFFAYFFPALENPKLEIYGPILLLVLLYFQLLDFIFPVITFIINKVFLLDIRLF